MNNETVHSALYVTMTLDYPLYAWWIVITNDYICVTNSHGILCMYLQIWNFSSFMVCLDRTYFAEIEN